MLNVSATTAATAARGQSPRVRAAETSPALGLAHPGGKGDSDVGGGR